MKTRTSDKITVVVLLISLIILIVCVGLTISRREDVRHSFEDNSSVAVSGSGNMLSYRQSNKSMYQFTMSDGTVFFAPYLHITPIDN